MDRTRIILVVAATLITALYVLGGCDEFLVEQGLHLNLYDCVEFLGEAKCSGPLAP